MSKGMTTNWQFSRFVEVFGNVTYVLSLTSTIFPLCKNLCSSQEPTSEAKRMQPPKRRMRLLETRKENLFGRITSQIPEDSRIVSDHIILAQWKIMHPEQKGVTILGREREDNPYSTHITR
jgi:hypothetical protein